MQAVTHPVFGEPTEVLELTEAPEPQPGTGEVRVRLLASPSTTTICGRSAANTGSSPSCPRAPAPKRSA